MAGASIRRSDAIEQGVKPMVVRESGNPYDAISQADRDQAKHMDTEARARGFKSAADLKAKSPDLHARLERLTQNAAERAENGIRTPVKSRAPLDWPARHARKDAAEGKGVAGRVGLGGPRNIKKK